MPSELIVDFSRLKCTAESGKTVRFAPLSELLCYEAHHKSDYSKLFYNSQDYRELMIQNRQAVIDVRMKLLPFLTSQDQRIMQMVPNRMQSSATRNSSHQRLSKK